MRKQKRIKLALQRADALQLTERDHRFIARLTTKGGETVSRSDAKAEKKFTRHCNEEARYSGGFNADVPTTGKELGPDYIGRFRLHDGSRHVSMRCWMRRGPK